MIIKLFKRKNDQRHRSEKERIDWKCSNQLYFYYKILFESNQRDNFLPFISIFYHYGSHLIPVEQRQRRVILLYEFNWYYDKILDLCTDYILFLSFFCLLWLYYTSWIRTYNVTKKKNIYKQVKQVHCQRKSFFIQFFSCILYELEAKSSILKRLIWYMSRTWKIYPLCVSIHVGGTF